jgi:CAAX protease family protein
VTIRSFADQRLDDLRRALTTLPAARTWLTCASVYAIFLVVAAPIGLVSGLLRPDMPHLAWQNGILTAVLIFIQPALLEEVLFRGLMLPRERRSLTRGRVVLVAAAALTLYVASHPLNARLFRPEMLGVFASPVYLILVTLLGLACTATYFISRSIWPPVAIHWMTVMMWLWFLGGGALLRGTR